MNSKGIRRVRVKESGVGIREPGGAGSEYTLGRTSFSFNDEYEHDRFSPKPVRTQKKQTRTARGACDQKNPVHHLNGQT